MREISHDIAYLQTLISNVFFVGPPGSGGGGGAVRPWTLVDAGMPRCANWIAATAERRFGAGARPEAIILTHGHFDHVGALIELSDRWGAPIYAHELEMPFLTGRSDYPPPDPAVGGGALARLAKLYPRRGIDLGGRVHALPADGSVPGMAGWRWIHTPGHAPGHVSLFRDADRALLAGDAFTTVKQESALAVLLQRQRVHGPPAYFTIDWEASRHSVQALAALRPEIGATGHGPPMYGEELRQALWLLAANFDRLAVPDDGRYVREPAIADRRGVVYVPPPVADPLPKLAAAVALAAVAGALVYYSRRGRHDRSRGPVSMFGRPKQQVPDAVSAAPRCALDTQTAASR